MLWGERRDKDVSVISLRVIGWWMDMGEDEMGDGGEWRKVADCGGEGRGEGAKLRRSVNLVGANKNHIFRL